MPEDKIRTIKLLKKIIREGCLPEFDSYRGECGKLCWTCHFYRDGTIIFGKTKKMMLENESFKGLLEDVIGELEI